jgi:hypothetical protein
MASLQGKILDKFIAELAKAGDLSEEQIAQMKALLNDRSKKLKADDVLKIFNPTPPGDLQ